MSADVVAFITFPDNGPAV